VSLLRLEIALIQKKRGLPEVLPAMARLLKQVHLCRRAVIWGDKVAFFYLSSSLKNKPEFQQLFDPPTYTRNYGTHISEMLKT
jgi:hypothetical protein